MSSDEFTRFLGNLGSDQDLQDALKERFGSLTGEIPADDLISFAEDQGYTFSVEDASEELSDEQLEGVAGGVDYFKLEDAQTYETLKIEYSLDTNTFNFLKF